MEAFAQSLLHVGNGTSASTGGSHAIDWSTGWLPDDSTAALMDAIYSDFSHRSPKLFTSRAILCTLNKNIAYFNRQVLEKFPGVKTVCNSRDQVVNQEDSFLLPTETMNAFEPASLPPHHLELKVDCVIMLLRNLEPSTEVKVFAMEHNYKSSTSGVRRSIAKSLGGSMMAGDTSYHKYPLLHLIQMIYMHHSVKYSTQCAWHSA